MKLPKAQQLPMPGVNYELRQLGRNGENPIHEMKVQHAFELKKPKLKEPKFQSPWLTMGGKK